MFLYIISWNWFLTNWFIIWVFPTNSSLRRIKLLLLSIFGISDFIILTFDYTLIIFCTNFNQYALILIKVEPEEPF